MSGPEEQAEEPAGWVVISPEGDVVASGAQTVTEAETGAGEQDEQET